MNQTSKEIERKNAEQYVKLLYKIDETNPTFNEKVEEKIRNDEAAMDAVGGVKNVGKVVVEAGKVAGVVDDVVKGSSKADNSLTRQVTKSSELDGSMLSKLKNEGVIPSAGRSGGERPLTGTPNSYVKTDAGHKLVYDSEGRLIYDISSERVKMTVWDKAPNGNMYPRDIKLEGSVPDSLLK